MQTIGIVFEGKLHVGRELYNTDQEDGTVLCYYDDGIVHVTKHFPFSSLLTGEIPVGITRFANLLLPENRKSVRVTLPEGIWFDREELIKVPLVCCETYYQQPRIKDLLEVYVSKPIKGLTDRPCEAFAWGSVDDYECPLFHGRAMSHTRVLAFGRIVDVEEYDYSPYQEVIVDVNAGKVLWTGYDDSGIFTRISSDNEGQYVWTGEVHKAALCRVPEFMCDGCHLFLPLELCPEEFYKYRLSCRRNDYKLEYILRNVPQPMQKIGIFDRDDRVYMLGVDAKIFN